MKLTVILATLNVLISFSLKAQFEMDLLRRDGQPQSAAGVQLSNEKVKRLTAVREQVLNMSLPDALQAALDSVRSIFDIVGVSVAIDIPAQGIWLGTSGYSVPATRDTIAAGMLFGIASNTKTFIAATLLQLQEEGILSLDDPLHKWLPTYRQDQYRYIDSTITIRQLLNHTSGIWNYLDPSSLYYADFVDSLSTNPMRFWLPESILTTFVRPPYFARGTDYRYSNTDYILAGMVIQMATHESISEQLHQRFLVPLNLGSTFLAVEDSLLAMRAHPWGNFYFTNSGRRDFYGFPLTAQYSLAWTAGALFSTPENMVRWIDSLYGGNVLKPSSLNQMLTFSSESDYSYGLAVIKASCDGYSFVGHSGRYYGYDSDMMYCPSAHLSIATTENNNYPLRYWVWPVLADVYFHHPTSVALSTSNTPAAYNLAQNYPNPFNPSTKIQYTIANRQLAIVKVFDLLGREVATLVNEVKQPGTYTVQFDARLPGGQGSNLASGVYFYSMKAGEYLATRRLLLLK